MNWWHKGAYVILYIPYFHEPRNAYMMTKFNNQDHERTEFKNKIFQHNWQRIFFDVIKFII